MAVYTYEVDHGDEPPPIRAGMRINGGRVTAVQFDAALERLEKIETAAKVLSDWYGKNTPGTYRPPGMDDLRKLLSINMGEV